MRQSPLLFFSVPDALENWKATNNFEAREWNRLNEGWMQSGKMDLEVELIYKDAEIAYLAQLPILTNFLNYPSHQRMGKCIDMLGHIKTVEFDEAAKIVAKQKAVKMKDGLDFEYAVYQFAFERLSDTDKERMNELYADIETDHQYLDQEEIIANLYDGKSELTPEAKDTLASLVAERSYNKFAKEHQLFHYFACIPLVEVARYFLKSKVVKISGKAMAKNQESDDEDSTTCDDVTDTVKAYAKKHDITVESMLKEGCRTWLDDGLIEAYTPLIASNNTELLERWLSTKDEARALLRGHIDSGELAVRERNDTETRKEKLYSKLLHDSEDVSAREVTEKMGINIPEKGEIDEKKAFEKFEGAVITGESLYAFKGDYTFVKEFRERVDRYDANLGIVYADDDPEHKGDHLDRELLICNLNNDGKPNFFSMYHMSTTLLSGLLKGQSYLRETKKGGATFLEFKSEEIENIFRERREMLIDGYAKLLAFQDVFKKLSREYEADLTHHVSERLKTLGTDIEQYNQVIKVATNTDDSLKKSERDLFRDKEVLLFEEELAIDISAIKPDEKAVEDHIEKLENILGEF